MLFFVAWRQNKLAKISQRAYLSVEPLGIALMVAGDRVIGHAGMYNAGNLPAQHVAWFLNIKSSLDHADDDFPIGDVRGDVVAIPRTLMPRGTPKGPHVQELLNLCNAVPSGDRSKERSVYLYVWGLIQYQDGFGNQRFTRFCHRCNWINRENPVLMVNPQALQVEYVGGFSIFEWAEKRRKKREAEI